MPEQNLRQLSWEEQKKFVLNDIGSAKAFILCFKMAILALFAFIDYIKQRQEIEKEKQLWVIKQRKQAQDDVKDDVVIDTDLSI